jgi:hypothetical protein
MRHYAQGFEPSSQLIFSHSNSTDNQLPKSFVARGEVR